MTGPAPIVETTYEPHRNLITDAPNLAKSSTGILPPARSGVSDPKPSSPALQESPTTPASRCDASTRCL